MLRTVGHWLVVAVWALMFVLGLPLGLAFLVVRDWWLGDDVDRGSPDAEAGIAMACIPLAGVGTSVAIIAVTCYFLFR